MKTIKNSYHKKLSFPLESVSIGANEIKQVSDSQAAAMVVNKWITLYDKTLSEKSSADDVIEKKDKGRKEIINNKKY